MSNSRDWRWARGPLQILARAGNKATTVVPGQVSGACRSGITKLAPFYYCISCWGKMQAALHKGCIRPRPRPGATCKRITNIQ